LKLRTISISSTTDFGEQTLALNKLTDFVPSENIEKKNQAHWFYLRVSIPKDKSDFSYLLYNIVYHFGQDGWEPFFKGEYDFMHFRRELDL